MSCIQSISQSISYKLGSVWSVCWLWQFLLQTSMKAAACTQPGPRHLRRARWSVPSCFTVCEHLLRTLILCTPDPARENLPSILVSYYPVSLRWASLKLMDSPCLFSKKKWAPWGQTCRLSQLSASALLHSEWLGVQSQSSNILSKLEVVITWLPWWLSGKKSTCHCRRQGLSPGSGRSPGEGNGNPLQYSCLEIPWTEEPGRLQ